MNSTLPGLSGARIPNARGEEEEDVTVGVKGAKMRGNLLKGLIREGDGETGAKGPSAWALTRGDGLGADEVEMEGGTGEEVGELGPDRGGQVTFGAGTDDEDTDGLPTGQTILGGDLILLSQGGTDGGEGLSTSGGEVLAWAVG